MYIDTAKKNKSKQTKIQNEEEEKKLVTKLNKEFNKKLLFF